MGMPATSASEAEDFKGIADRINEADLRPEFAEIQTNLACFVVGEIKARPGLKQVVFEDE